MRTPSQKQEKDLASVYGGNLQPGSGAFWSRKGDVRTDRFLIEAKMTENGSFSIKLPVWEKIRKEGLLDGRIPLLAVQIRGRNLVVMDQEDFLGLVSDAERSVGEGELP